MPDAVYHCELAWLGGEQIATDVRLDVNDGRLAAVTPGVAAPPGAIRLAGITIPGLANAHSHAFHRALRSRTHDGVGTFWTWRDAMYRVAGALDPDTYHSVARAVFGEMVLAGITCVGEFHYLHHQPDGTPYGDPNAMGHALIAAAKDVGIRITLLDTCYLGSGLTNGGALRAPEGAQRRFSDTTAEQWAERIGRLGESPTCRIGAAAHSVRAVDPASLRVVATWARTAKRPLHAHVSEQPAENEQCLAAVGLTPIGLLDECGMLDERFTAIHATHLDADDVDRLARTGSTVCLCPTTERDLADGIAPTAAFHEHGIPLAVGTDSHAIIDLFEESRAIELDERLATGVRGTHPVTSLLKAATSAGHRALGWPEAGQLTPGALADFTTITRRSVRTAGAIAGHAVATVVFAAAAADVTDVVIAGTHLVASGRHRHIDVVDELDRSIRKLWTAVTR